MRYLKSSACRTSLTVGGGTPVGNELDHCTRGTFALCDSTCDQTGGCGFRGEGNAVIGTEPRCKSKIAVDARAYYQLIHDSFPLAIQLAVGAARRTG